MHKQDGAQTHMFVAYTLSAPTSYISVVLPSSPVFNWCLCCVVTER